MAIAAKMIIAAIVFYLIVYHILRYLFDWYVFKDETKKQNTGPPRAYYPPLHKPHFLNIKKNKNHGNKSIKKDRF